MEPWALPAPATWCAAWRRARQTRVESRAAHDTNTGATGEDLLAQGTDTNQLDRDNAMEWKLLQRVDAEAAKAIEAEAAQKVR